MHQDNRICRLVIPTWRDDQGSRNLPKDSAAMFRFKSVTSNLEFSLPFLIVIKMVITYDIFYLLLYIQIILAFNVNACWCLLCKYVQILAFLSFSFGYQVWE